MNRQNNKKHNNTRKKHNNTRKKHNNTRKKHNNIRKKHNNIRKKHNNTRKKRVHRNHPLTPNSNSSIFSVPDKKYSDKIVIDTHHKQSGNIIPGLRRYLGNV
jgi:F0F1-type ATP synthase delta subunit